jgi:diguanylate cyclase (GGDEF)-like protein
MVFESRDRLMAIIETQTKVAEGLMGLDEVMDLVCLKARELTESAGAAVLKLEREQSVVVSASGSMERHLGARADAAHSLTAEAVGGRKIVRHGDSTKDGVHTRETYDSRSWVAVPILENDAAVAALVVTSPSPHHFEDEDVETARLLGRLLEAAFSQAASRAGASDRRDAVTGLGDRRAFTEQLKVEVARANRYGTPLCLALLQVAGLKTSASSDEAAVLRKVAALLKKTRTPDQFFRIDDDELAVILPNTPREGGLIAAARFKLMLEAEKLAGGRLSMNYGVAELAGPDPNALYAAADAALYAGSISRKDPV